MRIKCRPGGEIVALGARNLVVKRQDRVVSGTLVERQADQFAGAELIGAEWRFNKDRNNDRYEQPQYVALLDVPGQIEIECRVLDQVLGRTDRDFRVLAPDHRDKIGEDPPRDKKIERIELWQRLGTQHKDPVKPAHIKADQQE